MCHSFAYNYKIIIRIILLFELYCTPPNEGSFGTSNILNFISVYKFQLDCIFIYWSFASCIVKFIELIDWSSESLFFIRTQAPLIFLSFPCINSSTSPYFHLNRNVFSESKTIRRHKSFLFPDVFCFSHNCIVHVTIQGIVHSTISKFVQ